MVFTRDYENIKVKVQKYPDASSLDILDHIKSGLQKAPEQIIIYAGTNDTPKDTNYLKNGENLVKEICKDTESKFSSVICRTDIKDVNDTINLSIYHKFSFRKLLQTVKLSKLSVY